MKTLICINTCNRINYIKAFVYDFILFCINNKEYDFVISSDGKDNSLIEFCTKHKIPLVYSEKREGVGISKNRILKLFDDYDYYFFVEDDVELLNGDIFGYHINFAKKCDFQHMSLDEEYRFFGNKEIIKCDDYSLFLYDYGSAGFNFFTKEGIKKVGGFHTEFAKYKRFGHTEHTYRFVNAGLHKKAFIVGKDMFEGFCRWHNPASVTKGSDFEQTKNRIAIVEEDIIKEKLNYFPIKTLSKYYFNNFNKKDVKIKSLENVSIIEKKDIEIFELQKEINLMKKSTFWIMRNKYLKLKSFLKNDGEKMYH